MTQKSTQIFIVLTTSRVGGAEQRFFQLFCYFRELGFKNITLVLSESLLRELRPPKDATESWLDGCKVVNHTRYRQFLPAIFRLAWQFRRKNAVFHYYSPPPPVIHSLFGQKVIFSYTNSGFFEATLGRALPKSFTICALLLGATLDVLNEENYQKFLKWNFVKPRLFKTPAPFCQETIISSDEVAQKTNHVVLCGRLEDSDIKRVIYLLSLLPNLDAWLRNKTTQLIHLTLIGHGPRYSEAQKMIAKLDDLKVIRVELMQTHDPISHFKRAKVALSLQRNSNYPSRSLIEALSQGCLPIVTDVGETRIIARPEFTEYISDKFTAIELGEALIKIFSLSEEESLSRVKLMTDFIRENFSIEHQAEYYLKLYGLSTTNPLS